MNLSKQARNMMFIVMLTGSIITSMLQTALSTALPSIMTDLSISATTAQWLTSAYSLAMGIMIPATAFLIRRFPTKRLFLGAISLFAVGLLLCAGAPNFLILLIGRIIQAMGNGVLLSMLQVVILTIFPKEQRGSVMGIYGLAAGAAPVLAPTLAGIIIDIFDWHTIFWFALIIVAFDILMALKFMRNVLETEKNRFDFFSMLLSAVGFSGLLIGLGNIGTAGFFSYSLGLPLLIGIAALVLFVLRQLRSEKPFLELRILKNKDYRFAIIISMLMYAVMMASATLIPMYIQLVRGFSATKSGLLMMPGSFMMALISPFAGKFYDKFGIRKLGILGGACLTVSCLGFSFLGDNTHGFFIAITYIICLFSIGLVMMPIVTWGMSKIDQDKTAHGTALLTSLRTIAGSMGSAVFVALMTAATVASGGHADVAANTQGIHVAYLCITIVAAARLLLSVFFVGKKRKTRA